MPNTPQIYALHVVGRVCFLFPISHVADLAFSDDHYPSYTSTVTILPTIPHDILILYI
jgi:hypothetical protein